MQRRQLLAATGTLAAGVLAGCGSESGDRTYTGTRTGVPETVSSYLSATSNFDGQAYDWTDRESPTVDVGVEANGSNYGFGPAAIVVTRGTTVTWEWTGLGQAHNVVFEDLDVQSTSTAEEGFTFEHTFEETGAYRYFCAPHQNNGMKGAVVVRASRTSSAGDTVGGNE